MVENEKDGWSSFVHSYVFYINWYFDTGIKKDIINVHLSVHLW